MKKFMKRILDDFIDIACYSMLCIGFYLVMTNLCILNYFILMFGMMACEINNRRYLKNEFNKGYRHAAMLYNLYPHMGKHIDNNEESFNVKLPRMFDEELSEKKLLNTTHEVNNKCYKISNIVSTNDDITFTFDKNIE